MIQGPYKVIKKLSKFLSNFVERASKPLGKIFRYQKQITKVIVPQRLVLVIVWLVWYLYAKTVIA